MKRMMYMLLIISALACRTKSSQATYQPIFKPGPPLLVYKTKKDYSHLVPVRMDSTKTSIESYPAPSDLLREGKPVLPTSLEKGYLLDNAGISKNLAYLKISIEEYAKMDATQLSSEYLLPYVLEKDPLLELWFGGVRLNSEDLIGKLNASIQMRIENSQFVKLK